MTEAEKRALALQIMVQEQQRMAQKSKGASVLDGNKTLLRDVVQRATENKKLFDSLAQQGITWQQLKVAYDEGYQRGRNEMLDYNLSFFYAAASIVHHEVFASNPDEILAFIQSLPDALEGETNIDLIWERCLKQTGVDVSGFDKPQAQIVGKREAIKALERMKKTGITQKDVEYERQVGYDHGRNSEFHLSGCFAAAALSLAHTTSVIETFLSRVQEVMDAGDKRGGYFGTMPSGNRRGCVKAGNQHSMISCRKGRQRLLPQQHLKRFYFVFQFFPVKLCQRPYLQLLFRILLESKNSVSINSVIIPKPEILSRFLLCHHEKSPLSLHSSFTQMDPAVANSI